MTKKPVIGITGAYVNHNHYMEGVYVHHDYHKAVVNSGGIPIVLPFTNPETAKEMLNLCDGIILSGGEDVDPQFYGSDPHQKLGFVLPQRDIAEIALIKESLQKGIPLLGICRGLQILNVALGGTLIQDIPSKGSKFMQHVQTIPRPNSFHSVEITKGSLLAGIFDEEKIRVNSLHHQAIDKLAPELKATSHSADGIIEAVEYKGDSFALAVQWHPESMYSTSPKMQELFYYFLGKCQE